MQKATYLGITLSLLNFTSLCFAQERESLESQWRKAIESDIRNGAAEKTICSRAIVRAEISDDPDFKDWAYSVGRKFCKDGSLRPREGMAVQATWQSRPSCSLLSSFDAHRIKRGESVNLSGEGCTMIFNPKR